VITRTGVLNDVHFPLNDPRLITTEAKGLVLDIFEDAGVDRIVLNGDILDFYDISAYVKSSGKNPDVQFKLEDELQCGEDFLNNLRKRFPSAEIIWLDGNHEHRLDRFLLQVPHFWNLLRIQNMLPFEKCNVEYHPYNSRIQLEDTSLYVQHSPPSYSENGAATSLKKKFDQSHIWGCTHRVDSAVRTGASGKYHEAWFNGWLGSTDLTDQHKAVFSYVKNHQNWQNAACIVDIHNRTDFFVQQFLIKDYKTSINGVFYEG
jgi:predicted phosphodiesterase